MIELAHDHIPVCSSDFYIESPILSDKSMEMMLKDETYYLLKQEVSTMNIEVNNIFMMDDYVVLKPKNTVASHCHKMPHIILHLPRPQ